MAEKFDSVLYSSTPKMMIKPILFRLPSPLMEQLLSVLFDSVFILLFEDEGEKLRKNTLKVCHKRNLIEKNVFCFVDI